MRKGKFRLTIILLVFVLVSYYLLPLIFPNIKGVLFTDKKLKLGLDLQGGMQILLQVEVDSTKLLGKNKDEAVKSALEIIRNRVDQFGVSEPVIQLIGENRINVQLPGVRDFVRAKNLIGKTALLEFKLVAEDAIIAKAIDQLEIYFDKNREKYDYLSEYVSPSSSKVDVVGNLLDLQETDTTINSDTEEEIEPSVFSKLIGYDENLQSLIISEENVRVVSDLIKDEEFIQNTIFGYQFYIGKKQEVNRFSYYPLYLLENKTELTGNYLENAAVKFGDAGNPMLANKPYVNLIFDKTGSNIFETITEQNIKRRLAVVLDGVVYIAPVIQDKIRGGEAQITGSFTIDEAQDIVIVLKAGNLPAPVTILQESSTGPTLGADSIRTGFIAGLFGFLIILLFMVFYYKFSGLIANIAVIVNISFILAALTMLEATLTMPGIAGIILTIGMAVDASVLIFERIREEHLTGKTVYSSVEKGFNRAFITILDANITTLITAAVLYQFGSGPIKGFAVTLSIGIIGSMFTSIILIRAIFDNFFIKSSSKTISI